MTVVSAFLVPGSPLPLLRQDNPAWANLCSGYRAAARALAASRPDVILLYSTQWGAVLDQLWQLKPHLKGVHVDENWYEYGDLPFDLRIDTELARACVEGCSDIGISAKGIDYDEFPVDTGTIVASEFLNSGKQLPFVIAANNFYYDFDKTYKIGEMAAQRADQLNRRVAVVGVGGLSGQIFRDQIDIRDDGIKSEKDDRLNRMILGYIQNGDMSAIREMYQRYAKEAKAEMGFKHFGWIWGALGGNFSGAKVHAYGATYGAGAAVIEFKL